MLIFRTSNFVDLSATSLSRWPSLCLRSITLLFYIFIIILSNVIRLCLGQGLIYPFSESSKHLEPVILEPVIISAMRYDMVLL